MTIDVGFSGGQDSQVPTGIYLCRLKGIRTATHAKGNRQAIIDAQVKPHEEAGPEDYISQSWYVFFERADGTKIKVGCLLLQNLAAATGHADSTRIDEARIKGAVLQVGLEYENDGQHKPKNVPRVFAPKGQAIELPEDVRERAAEQPFIDPEAQAEPGDDADLDDNGGF